MSRHSQPHKRSRVLETLIGSAIGIVLAAVVMFYLARAVLEFGNLAFGGEAQAWIFTLAAAVGVLACLAVIVVVVVRCLRMLGFIREYKPRRAMSRRSK